MGSIALTVLSLILGSFFIFIGHFKVTPQFFPEIHEDMRREFGRVNKVFPLYEVTGWRPYAKNYRLTVGLIEVICGAILVFIPGRLKQMANFVLLMLMLGVVYTHYVLHDKFERMAPPLVFGLLLLTRLIIYRQVTQREKKQEAKKKKVKATKESESDNADEVGQGSDDQESPNDEKDKQKISRDKKSEKKNK